MDDMMAQLFLRPPAGNATRLDRMGHIIGERERANLPAVLTSKAPLYAGPWYGEFAFAVYWAALLRAIARASGRRITVCSRPGDGALFADFAHEFIAHDIKCLGQCSHSTPDTRPDPRDVMKWIPRGVDRFAPCEQFDPIRPLHVVYGREVPEYRNAVVVHARNRKHAPERNWPIESCNEVVARLAADGVGPFVCVGSVEESLPVAGTLDLRGADLQTQMDVMRSARMMFGVSSGPMHLASHCGCPHLVWYSGLHGEWQLTRDRYIELWNPHGTPAWAHFVAGWRPSVSWVLDNVRRILKALPQRADFPPAPREGNYGWSFRMPGDAPGLSDDAVGVGVLVYKNLSDAQGAVAAIRKHTHRDIVLLMWDNSPGDEIAKWAQAQGDLVYIHDQRNIGCSVSRNRMAEEFARRGIAHFVVMDQDVRPCHDRWLPNMLEVFKHPSTGVAGWHLGTLTMSPRTDEYRPDATGCVPEIPGMCAMYSTQAIAECGGWHPDIFHFREDTLICLMLAKAGYMTRVIWPDTNGVRHDHGHKAMSSNPRCSELAREGQAVFEREVRKYRLHAPSSLLPGASQIVWGNVAMTPARAAKMRAGC